MKILIIQLRRIGDVLLTTPAVREVKHTYPGATIDFLVEAPGAQALEGNPNINSILTYNKNERWQWIKRIHAAKYDVVIDFLNNPRSAQLTLASRAGIRAGFNAGIWSWVYNKRIAGSKRPIYTALVKFKLLEHIGIKPEVPLVPEIYLSNNDREFADRWLSSQGMAGNRPLIGIIPTHRRAVRKWTAEGFAGVGERLIKDFNATLILFWGPGEYEEVKSIADMILTKLVSESRTTVEHNQKNKVNLAPESNIKEMAALLAKCDLVITNDSGPMHTAVAMGTPTVTIYGPTQPKAWNPSYLNSELAQKHRVVQAYGLACLGCNKNICPYKHECMQWVTPDQALNTCKNSLYLEILRS